MLMNIFNSIYVYFMSFCVFLGGWMALQCHFKDGMKINLTLMPLTRTVFI